MKQFVIFYRGSKGFSTSEVIKAPDKKEAKKIAQEKGKGHKGSAIEVDWSKQY